MASSVPPTMRAIVMHKSDSKPPYHPAILEKEWKTPQAGPGQVLVKIKAAAFNHRDIWARKGLYPGVVFPSIVGSDAYGEVVAPPNHPLIHKPILIHSAIGWEKSPDGPEGTFGIFGSTQQTQGRGMFAEYAAVEEQNAIECPNWLVEEDGGKYAAAIPLGSVTAWRAVFTKGQVKSGQNVLITGIGGGVALQALQFCVAAGANVWVSSGSLDKIESAKKLGAKGGVSYKDDNWAKQLGQALPSSQPELDVVIDSGGGDIVSKTTKLLKHGGIVVCYGSTTGTSIPIGMPSILKNIDFKGSTMGSLNEFKDAVEFINKHRIKPVVHTVIDGLEKAEEGFEIMKEGKQFGKIVLRIDPAKDAKL